MLDAKKSRVSPSWDHPDWIKLHEIGLVIERERGSLPSVRRDSPEWQAWRAWRIQRGSPTAWSDRQPPETMMTVTFPFPPFDLEAEYQRWVPKKRGTDLKLIERAKPKDWE